ncbi:MAG: bifunctional phosphopantothenoylcysteine decarboxylase/phosphopantothenate--cysteine ligase CoaBC [Fibrobacterota bacterium]
MLSGKNIILGISGGIAACKTPELIRLLRKEGAAVKTVATENGLRFAGKAALSALSGNPVLTDIFDEGLGGAPAHIEITDKADLFLTAPATADVISKFACGTADDALSSLYAATGCPVLIAPSMNSRMWESPAVKRNCRTLSSDGVFFCGPAEGELACGTSGRGRMSEPREIVDACIYHLTEKKLAGKKALVTAGPTREAIDPVRFISNRSGGLMGYSMAFALSCMGAETKLISGPVKRPAPYKVDLIAVETAAEMYDSVMDVIKDVDISVFSAAVGDFTPADYSNAKIKKSSCKSLSAINLKKTRDILAEVSQTENRGFTVGFCLETGSPEEEAARKLKEKKCDMIVANNALSEDAGFESHTNRVSVLFPGESPVKVPLMEKRKLGFRLADIICKKISGKKNG